VDIHRKPGYDPVELFFDPSTKSIPLNGKLVKGSHGRLPIKGQTSNPVFVSNIKNIGTENDNDLSIVTIGKYLKSLIA
jgi:hypothetical protein